MNMSTLTRFEVQGVQSPPFIGYTPEVYRTRLGVPYLREPGVVLVGQTVAAPKECVHGFLGGFDDGLEMTDYLGDPDPLENGDGLAKFAGQLCYLSFDRNRTKNAETRKYLDNLKSQGHGSVLEHPQYSFLFYGVDRTFTHELVRHRAGFGYSQVSQRYVDGPKLRFVQRPEYWPYDRLGEGGKYLFDVDGPDYANARDYEHEQFMLDINNAKREYDNRAARLAKLRDLGHPMLQGGDRRDLRKKLNQTARDRLPNCTEAPIVVSANARAWRNLFDQRATPHADVQIRRAAFLVYTILNEVAPGCFGDYVPEYATNALNSPYRKV